MRQIKIFIRSTAKPAKSVLKLTGRIEYAQGYHISHALGHYGSRNNPIPHFYKVSDSITYDPFKSQHFISIEKPGHLQCPGFIRLKTNNRYRLFLHTPGRTCHQTKPYKKNNRKTIQHRIILL